MTSHKPNVIRGHIETTSHWTPPYHRAESPLAGRSALRSVQERADVIHSSIQCLVLYDLVTELHVIRPSLSAPADPNLRLLLKRSQGSETLSGLIIRKVSRSITLEHRRVRRRWSCSRRAIRPTVPHTRSSAPSDYRGDYGGETFSKVCLDSEFQGHG